ncbi:unnamed protein product [Gulo gulo]|uniref:Uncharacterized protein n=1 Tax=Gulo gulo TaxID=48420 RepID=A0A9X9Q959_GULGU|nr:unnamed protein product [Gulo gulo]
MPLQPVCSLVLGNCGRLGEDLRELGKEGGKQEVLWRGPRTVTEYLNGLYELTLKRLQTLES